jgi:hypothetical protein
MADLDKEIDLPAESETPTESRLNINTKDGTEAADDFVRAQREAMRDQKNPHREPTQTSMIFGRSSELLGDAQMTNLGDGKSGDKVILRPIDPYVERAEKEYVNLVALALSGQQLDIKQQSKFDGLSKTMDEYDQVYERLADKQAKKQELSYEEKIQLRDYKAVHDFHQEYESTEAKPRLTAEEKRFMKVLKENPAINRVFEKLRDEKYEPVPEVM